MALTAIVTNAGRAALVNAANTGTAPVTIAQVGLTATAVVPGVGITALPGEYKRVATISGDVVADDTIHLIVRDESADVFTLRSFALYLADGTLFAIYGQADVILEKSAQAMMLLAIDVQFADVAAAMLTFGDTNFLNPPATTSVQGVVELATEEEATTGVDTVRAVTPKGMKSAVTSWLNSRFGEGAPSAFVKGLLSLASAALIRVELEIKSAALKDEGAGNGLDADLLDGQHGSYYTNIPSRLGYVPWGPSNDGSGSGLDADLLDGQDSSYYANITARLGYTPANRAGDTFLGAVTVIPGSSMGVSAGANAGGAILSGGDATHTGLLAIYQSNGTRLGYVGYALNGGRMNYVSDNGSGHSFLGGALYRDGNVVWDSANDGAGSGLDADLLDGQDGGYYTNITARLGYTPANRAGDTFLGSTTVVPGASMGVNAGANAGGAILSGGDATHTGLLGLYQSNGVRLGYVGYASNGSRMNYASENGMGHSFIGGGLYRDGNAVWDAANDGSGSGLDADLLDGYQAADFLRVTSNLIEVGGRRVHTDGYIEHWGKILFRRTGEVGFRFDFPTAFPNECFGVHFTVINTTGHYDGDSQLQEVALDRLGINVFLQSDTGGQQDYYGFRWFARGR